LAASSRSAGSAWVGLLLLASVWRRRRLQGQCGARQLQERQIPSGRRQSAGRSSIRW
jgi:hypothetical protein